MIKSRKKTISFEKTINYKRQYKVDSSQYWKYQNTTKQVGNKYSIHNTFVYKTDYSVKKTYKQGKDLVDF